MHARQTYAPPTTRYDRTFRTLNYYGRTRRDIRSSHRRTYATPRRQHYTQVASRVACLRAARYARAQGLLNDYVYARAPDTRVYAYTTSTDNKRVINERAHQHQRDVSLHTYDSDSYILLVDNCCSTSITNNIKDYIYPPRTVHANVEGFNGVMTATKVGTVRWVIQDDLGCTHKIILPNTYYSPHGKYCLLCPQHWAQTANDNHPHPNGTWCATYADRIQLHWGQRKYVRTIKLLPKTNVGILTAAPGITKYITACTALERAYSVLALPTMTTIHTTNVHPISDDKDENVTVHRSSASPPLARTITPEPEGEGTANQRDDQTNDVQHDNTPVIISFPDNGGKEEDVTLPHPQLERDQQELLYWYIRLSHLSFARLMWMAKWVTTRDSGRGHFRLGTVRSLLYRIPLRYSIRYPVQRGSRYLDT
jgi:hypothetical protein